MAPIKTKFTPMRNQAGRFVKGYLSTATSRASTSSGSTMKSISPVKGRKLKRRRAHSDVPRVGKKTSVVWNFFRALPHENGVSRAVCLLCKVVFKNPGGSTTGMRGHLDRKHPGVVDRVLSTSTSYQPEAPTMPFLTAKREIFENGRPGSPPPPPLTIETGDVEVEEAEVFDEQSMAELEIIHSQSSSQTSQCTSTSSQSSPRRHVLPGPPPAYTTAQAEETTRSMVLYLLSDMRPLETVDDPFFKKMVQNLNGLYMLRSMGRNTDSDTILPFVSATLDNMYEEMKEEIKREIHDKDISLSLQLWAKSNTEIFLSVTATYMTFDWRPESKFIAMRLIPDMNWKTLATKVEGMVEARLLEIFQEYNIKPDRVVQVTVSSYPVFCPKNVCSHQIIPCFAETLRKTYLNVDKAVRYKIGAPNAPPLVDFGKLLLPNYDVVRNHPGRLVESLMNLLKIDKDFEKQVPRGTVSALEALAKLQLPLNEIVDCLLEESTTFTASTVLPMMCALRDLYKGLIESDILNWSQTDKKNLFDQINSAIQSQYGIDLSKNEIGDSVLIICTFLDPRYKKMNFLTEEQRQFVHDTIIELLYDCSKRPENSGTGSIVSVRTENPNYADLNGNSSSTDPLTTTTPTVSPPLPSPQLRSTSKFASIMSKVIQRKYVPAPSPECQEELRRYLREPVPIVEMDPCLWWRGNYDKYPTLARLAKRYLCVKGISRSVRLTFTQAGDNLRSKIINLDHDLIDKMMCLRRHHKILSTSDPYDAENVYVTLSSIKNEDLMDEDCVEPPLFQNLNVN